MSTTHDEIKALLRDALDATGRDLNESSEQLAEYAAEQADRLSLAIGEPGFDQAVIAARDNIALRAGIAATDAADEFDTRIIGVIAGVLRLGARAIAAA